MRHIHTAELYKRYRRAGWWPCCAAAAATAAAAHMIAVLLCREERRALEEKYDALYAPIYAKRSDVINGRQEAPENETGVHASLPINSPYLCGRSHCSSCAAAEQGKAAAATAIASC